MVKAWMISIGLWWCTAVAGALPGVTELGKSPEQITDRELAVLLGERVGSSDVIAIGESIHGSSSFLRVQARVIRYLVVNHGIRLVVWENPTLRSLELGRWVSSCATPGTRTPAPIDVLYMPTAADRALWDWVCDYNRQHPSNPILFRGMDIWDRPWEHHARIEALAVRVGVDNETVDRVRQSCSVSRLSSWPQIEARLATLQSTPGEYDRCRVALTTIMHQSQQLGKNLKSAKTVTADDAYELAISASTLMGWLGFYRYFWSDDVLSWNERDQAQARNTMLVMEQHGAARAILSAHTSHVSHNRSKADWWGYGDLKSGVFFFQAMTEKKVFNIALTAYEASGTQGAWLTPTAASSMDRKLHHAGHRFSFFLAHAPFLSEYARWWMQNGNAPEGLENGIEIAPADHFDAYFFFSQSLLDQALPARPMWQP